MKWISSIYDRGAKEGKPGKEKETLYPGGVKKCTRCKQEKLIEFFHQEGKYRASRCKECLKQLWAEKYWATHVRKKVMNLFYPTQREKICSKCGVVQPVSNFYRAKTQYQAKCKKCANAITLAGRKQKKARETEVGRNLQELWQLFTKGKQPV